MFIPSLIRLGHTSLPFDHEDWLFELKYDGFRALSVIENGQCRFLSRNRNPLRGLDRLAEALVQELKVDRAILDGELAVIDEDGRTVFKSMMFERHRARFCAFDVLSGTI
jgi:bifunctional non-homologous end joining protein LigD